MNKLDTVRNLVKDFDSTSRLYQHLNKTTSYYGTDTLLTPAEIHAISLIASHSNINLSQLAELLSVTKGTATKSAQKLVKKEMIYKNFAKGSENIVELTLTDKGTIAAENHKTYVDYMEKQLIEIYYDISDQTTSDLVTINQRTTDFFNKLIRERESEVKK
ncbi:MarR family transcriptional regulator [Leuconostoc falkenbergense]|uniref:MarR family winged helix-turn-helix transcriptional regulator n=1 Tax=Leuconostoc falkenbergense TaxID=2766470 RepID=UPI0021AA9616|nr:MarR family transcriptional regulator [Leuconostoc falkenbergense]MCT4403725.1 MarR family transcriptional regulator [Leuconostoc falkenbergense]